MGKRRSRTLPDKTGREDLGKGPWTDGFLLCLWASSGLNMIILCWSPSEAHRQGAQPEKEQCGGECCPGPIIGRLGLRWAFWSLHPRPPHGITLACRLDRAPCCFSKCVPLLSFIFYLYWLRLLASSHCGVFNLYKPPSACASPSNNLTAKVHLQFFSPLSQPIEAWALPAHPTPKATAAIPTQPDGPVSAPCRTWPVWLSPSLLCLLHAGCLDCELNSLL